MSKQKAVIYQIVECRLQNREVPEVLLEKYAYGVYTLTGRMLYGDIEGEAKERILKLNEDAEEYLKARRKKRMNERPEQRLTGGW